MKNNSRYLLVVAGAMVATMVAQDRMATSNVMYAFPQPAIAAQKLSVDGAINQVKLGFKNFLRRATRDNSVTAAQAISAVPEYLSYYRSFFQAVTPAPREIYDAVYAYGPSREFVEGVIKIAEDNFTRPARAMAGSSKLTADGERYFQKVLSLIQDKLS
jgi:hypothetical protein